MVVLVDQQSEGGQGGGAEELGYLPAGCNPKDDTAVSRSQVDVPFAVFGHVPDIDRINRSGLFEGRGETEESVLVQFHFQHLALVEMLVICDIPGESAGSPQGRPREEAVCQNEHEKKV